MFWTDERIEVLNKMWSKGFSASQIAARIGGCTRSAVIGKVHRLKLAGDRAQMKKPQRTVPKKKPRSDTPHFRVRTSCPNPLPNEDPYIVPLAKRVGIEGVEQDQCRWPYGDPRAPVFHFCDRKKVIGLPYCEAHARRAVRPAKAKRPSVTGATEPVAEDAA